MQQDKPNKETVVKEISNFLTYNTESLDNMITQAPEVADIFSKVIGALAKKYDVAESDLKPKTPVADKDGLIGRYVILISNMGLYTTRDYLNYNLNGVSTQGKYPTSKSAVRVVAKITSNGDNIYALESGIGVFYSKGGPTYFEPAIKNDIEKVESNYRIMTAEEATEKFGSSDVFKWIDWIPEMNQFLGRRLNNEQATFIHSKEYVKVCGQLGGKVEVFDIKLGMIIFDKVKSSGQFSVGDKVKIPLTKMNGDVEQSGVVKRAKRDGHKYLNIIKIDKASDNNKTIFVLQTEGTKTGGDYFYASDLELYEDDTQIFNYKVGDSFYSKNLPDKLYLITEIDNEVHYSWSDRRLDKTKVSKSAFDKNLEGGSWVIVKDTTQQQNIKRDTLDIIGKTIVTKKATYIVKTVKKNAKSFTMTAENILTNKPGNLKVPPRNFEILLSGEVTDGWYVKEFLKSSMQNDKGTTATNKPITRTAPSTAQQQKDDLKADALKSLRDRIASSNTGNRPSPTDSATNYYVGFSAIGNDGGWYEIVQDKNAKRRWAKIKGQLAKDNDNDYSTWSQDQLAARVYEIKETMKMLDEDDVEYQELRNDLEELNIYIEND